MIIKLYPVAITRVCLPRNFHRISHCNCIAKRAAEIKTVHLEHYRAYWITPFWYWHSTIFTSWTCQSRTSRLTEFLDDRVDAGSFVVIFSNFIMCVRLERAGGIHTYTLETHISTVPCCLIATVALACWSRQGHTRHDSRSTRESFFLSLSFFVQVMAVL